MERLYPENPLCIDLYAGLGGWAEGFLAEGYEVHGYDIEAHDYGTGGYPGQLELRDVLTIHGSEFKDAACIVASPPCQEYSYMAMPWSLAKAKRAAILADKTGELRRKLTALFDACFRIQREASDAAGRHIPMVVENVRGAQEWVGRAPWHYGSFYLWGDVPALMPMTASKVCKVPGFSFDGSGKSYQTEAIKATGQKNPGGGSWDRSRPSHTTDHSWDSEHYFGDGCKVPGINLSDGGVGFNTTAAQRYREGVKQAGISGKRENGKGDKWFQDGAAAHGSRSNSRKAASAMIAKIPFPLASHIARVYKP